MGYFGSNPEGAILKRRGLDYGYTNDPTAIIDVYEYNGGYLLDEQVYKKGMTNKDIADVINSLDKCLTVADSSEPKSNDELRLYGVSVIPAVKGPGSVLYGIQLIQSKPIYVTKRSVFLIKEYRNYLWMTDKHTNQVINEPEDLNNHAMDACRYAISSLNPRKSGINPDQIRHGDNDDELIYPEIGM